MYTEYTNHRYGIYRCRRNILEDVPSCPKYSAVLPEEFSVANAFIFLKATRFILNPFPDFYIKKECNFGRQDVNLQVYFPI